jgi:hypothetical protein
LALAVADLGYMLGYMTVRTQATLTPSPRRLAEQPPKSAKV